MIESKNNQGLITEAEGKIISILNLTTPTKERIKHNAILAVSVYKKFLE